MSNILQSLNRTVVAGIILALILLILIALMKCHCIPLEFIKRYQDLLDPISAREFD